MILSFKALVVLLSLAVPIYWVIPERLHNVRMTVVSSASIFALFLVSPVIPIVAMAYALLFAVCFALNEKQMLSGQVLKFLGALSFVPLVLPGIFSARLLTVYILGHEVDNGSLMSSSAWLGLSFLSIRCFVAIRELPRQQHSFMSTLAALVFFGSYAAGPLSGGGPYQAAEKKLSALTFSEAFCRLGWGMALLFVVAPWFRHLDLSTFTVTASAWLSLYRNFVSLYSDFAGATGIAIAIGLFFGIRLPENFNSPFLATSLQSFWQRWHMSFIHVVRTYAVGPLVRKYGNINLAVMIVFPLVGLWHSFSIPYLLWGVFHGAGLVANRAIGQLPWPSVFGNWAPRVMAVVGWIFTMTFVSLLSTLANLPDIGSCVAMISRLAGWP
jgi:D-alanyl-lipoteichoic acid acyltransferase DltB (MBOAT superfamily)